jgi:cytochrome c-type biogenesis protein CcmH
MTFWMILAITLSAAAALLSAPFIRRLDRSRAEPVVPAFSARERNFTVIAVAGIVVLGSAGLYSTVEKPARPSTVGSVLAQRQSPSVAPEPSIPKDLVAPLQTFASEIKAQPQSGLPPVDEMIQRLAARLVKNPNDGQGWRTLGWSYLNIGRFSEASEAYAKAIELSPNVTELRLARIEALVRAADGVVTAEASNAVEDTLKIDLQNPRARFFRGLAKEQGGDKSSALTDWVDVLRDAGPDEPWVPDLKNRIAGLERELGLNVTARPAAAKEAVADGLPETSKEQADSPTPPAAERGPGPLDVRTADAMAPAERSAMIEGMVDRLADRLEKSPHDADGWIKLIRSRMVLGEAELAKKALSSGIEAFHDDTQQRDRIIVAAQQLGLNQ